ncbi:MAG: metallophosphoesterase [Candidatus Eremiobacteraeota bacterium]|nr:metallophosphoesterase [Candidatus Eremiobacteraeota bacterium]
MIRIYHTSDLHNRRGIVEPLRALRARAPGLLIDCGDALRGSQTVFFPREPILHELDAAGYDLQAMGNREFNYVFAAVRARVAQMRHPFVCSNLIDLKGRPLPFARDYRIVRDDGERGWTLRFCALLVPQYPVGSAWERLFGWRFLEPQAVAQEHASALGDGETLIVLSHLGLRADRALARSVPRIDLILGGHSHDTLEQPEVVGETPIVHAGPYGRYVSRSELVYDARKRAALNDYALLPLLGS